MIHKSGIATAALALAAAACAPLPSTTPPAVTPAVPVQAADFEAAITRLETNGLQSPQALNARLQYADFLLDQSDDGCARRLTEAQAQLDNVAAKPAAEVLLALGPAQLAGGAYKLHLARAGCGTPDKSELAQALTAAQRAVGLYQDALDYPSAAIMQFNAATTDYALGDTPAAIAALQTAIAMDRDYGFRDDAEDNTRTLLRWQGGAASDSDVAAALKGFPARKADFKFHWPGGGSDVAIRASDASVIDGKIIRSQAAGTLKRQVTPGPKGWTVSNTPGTGTLQAGDWPADTHKDLEWSAMYFLASALSLAPTIQIAKNGDFTSVNDAQAFGTGLAAKLSAQLAAIPSDSADATLKAAFTPDFIETSARQDYGLETGTWIGASLEQGVWYQMTTPLFLSALGLGHYLVNHDISFAFTRQLPCTAAAPQHLCAEIVVHAVPDRNDLDMAVQAVRAQMKLPPGQSLYYWSMMDLRLVIDPDTLVLYGSDKRQYWYDALTGGGQSDPLIESIRTVATTAN